jgi:putative ABC transport system permease protein
MIKKESIAYSLRNVKNRKTRSFFTIFSIMLGITTIFIFVSFGTGLYKYIQDMSSASSFDKILIQSKGGMGGLDTTFLFNENDLRAVKRSSGVYEATGIFFKVTEIKQRDKIAYSYLISYDPSVPLMIDISGLKISKGRELKSGDRGIVLGYNYQIKDKIFPKAYELNDEIEVNGNKFKILGFYEPIGDPIDDAQIYVTSDIAKEMFDSNSSNNWLAARVDVSNVEGVIKNIEGNLREERNLEEGKEDFFVQSFQDMIESYTSILNIVVGFIILIAFISVLVSSLNTANTMVTSVLERTKEIGILKSVGGTNSEVFSIFLFESSFLGFVAGCLGVFFGWIFSFIGGEVLKNLGYGFLAPYFSWWLFLSCITFAVLTGAISGIIPAIKASRTNPVETLRYE